MVSRDLRPDETVPGTCPHPLTGEDMAGGSKAAVFVAIRDAVAAGMVNASGSLRLAVEELFSVLLGCESVIGQKPPECLVIGNRGRAKMTSEEQQLMIRVETALRHVISQNEPDSN